MSGKLRINGKMELLGTFKDYGPNMFCLNEAICDFTLKNNLLYQLGNTKSNN